MSDVTLPPAEGILPVSASHLRDPQVFLGSLLERPSVLLKDAGVQDPAAPPSLPPAADLDDGTRGSSGGSGAGGGDPQQVFTGVLLSVVGAYGITRSVLLTMLAAVIALLVTVLINRRH